MNRWLGSDDGGDGVGAGDGGEWWRGVMEGSDDWGDGVGGGDGGEPDGGVAHGGGDAGEAALGALTGQVVQGVHGGSKGLVHVRRLFLAFFSSLKYFQGKGFTI